MELDAQFTQEKSNGASKRMHYSTWRKQPVCMSPANLPRSLQEIEVSEAPFLHLHWASVRSSTTVKVVDIASVALTALKEFITRMSITANFQSAASKKLWK